MNLEEVRDTLLSMKAELEARLVRTHKHIHLREEAVSANFSEQIKQTENDTLVMALDQEAKGEIHQIDCALKRVESGDYFNCSHCGEAIGLARLRAIPDTSLCIDCADDTSL